MLSSKAKYGLNASLLLAREHNNGPMLISNIARKEKIPEKFLSLILLQLKNKGILQSRKGRGGGYLLARSPDLITFGEIIRTLDGPLAPTPCVSETAFRKCTECADPATCGIKMVMKEVRDSIAGILDNTSLADVIAGNVNYRKGGKKGERGG